MARKSPATWSPKHAQAVARAQAKGYASPYYEREARALATFGQTPAELRTAKAQSEGFRSYWQKRETLKEIKAESQRLYSNPKEQQAYQKQKYEQDITLLKNVGKEHFERIREVIHGAAEKVAPGDPAQQRIFIQFTYECEIALVNSPDGHVPQEVKDRFYQFLLSTGLTSGQAMAIYSPMLRALY